jgi:hypothetical protein
MGMPERSILLMNDIHYYQFIGHRVTWALVHRRTSAESKNALSPMHFSLVSMKDNVAAASISKPGHFDRLYSGVQ